MTDSGLQVYANQVELAAEVTRAEVTGAVRAAAAAQGVGQGEISVTFVEAPAIAALNRTHRGSPDPTDVIAFNLAEADAPLGDVYICPEVARESAAERGLAPREELLRLVVHGVLHVFGWDHPEGVDRLESEMFRRQEEILSQLL